MPSLAEAEKKTSPQLKRSVIGGVIGNVLEWYDFAIFGFLAPVIASQFFPSEDKYASLIKVFGVFAAGYLMRPLGGMVFGYIGDKKGRKKALQISVAMMAIPTTLVGLLPTYANVGVLAAMLLILLRLAQGLSIGGELIGSISYITETAPDKRRGFFGSWTLFSAVAGILLGSAVAWMVHSFIPSESLTSWGWRIPFLLGIGIGGFGLWMRKGLPETAEFKKAEAGGETGGNPVRQVLKEMPGTVAHLAAVVILLGGGIYMCFVWMPTYLSQIVKPAVPHALMLNTIAMVVLIGLMPLAGALSDKIGRKKVIGLASLGFIVVGYPAFQWLDSGGFALALLGLLLFAVFMAGIQGPIPALMVEMFPTRLRYSGVAIGYNLTLALFGGTAPMICTWLIERTGDIAAPAYYLIAMSVVSLLSVLLIKETRGKPLS